MLQAKTIADKPTPRKVNAILAGASPVDGVTDGEGVAAGVEAAGVEAAAVEDIAGMLDAVDIIDEDMAMVEEAIIEEDPAADEDIAGGAPKTPP